MRAGVQEAEVAAVVLGRDVEAIVVAEVVGAVVEGSGEVAGLVKGRRGKHFRGTRLEIAGN